MSPHVTNGLSASQAMTGDVYNLQILVGDSGNTAITQDWTATPASKTFSAPTALGALTTTVPSTTPYPVIKTTWQAYANTIGYTWSGTQTLTAVQCGITIPCTITWNAALSPGYIGTATEYQMPNLSSLAGWSTDLQLKTGISVAGFVTANTSSRGPQDFPLVSPAPAGTQRVVVATDWTSTP
jgi:hypothetical protein